MSTLSSLRTQFHTLNYLLIRAVLSEVIALRDQLDYIYVITILGKNHSKESVKYLRKPPFPPSPERRLANTGGWLLISIPPLPTHLPHIPPGHGAPRDAGAHPTPAELEGCSGRSPALHTQVTGTQGRQDPRPPPGKGSLQRCGAARLPCHISPAFGTAQPCARGAPVLPAGPCLEAQNRREWWSRSRELCTSALKLFLCSKLYLTGAIIVWHLETSLIY